MTPDEIFRAYMQEVAVLVPERCAGYPHRP